MSSANIMIGYALLKMTETAAESVPATEVAWAALTDIGYTDPEAGGVFDPGITIKESRPAGQAAPVAAYLVNGDCSLKITLLESDIGNIAWGIGGKAADIDDNAVDAVKTMYGPVSQKAVQRFNLQLEQINPSDTTIKNYIRMVNAYIADIGELAHKEGEERKVALTIKALAVETAGDWLGYSYAMCEEYAAA